VFCVIAMAGADVARAQAPQGLGWHVSLDFFNVATRGNDVHVGDVFTEQQTISGTVIQSRLDYGVTYEPIVTRMKTDRSVMISGGYRGARWGFGARGWRAATDDAVSGSDSTAPSTATSDFLTGVRMWENSIVPVSNDQEPSGISPVTFDAANELEHLRFEGFVERMWVSANEVRVAARLGVAHARTENIRSEGQTQRAFLVEISGGTTSTLTNSITLESDSEATANLTGPLLALVGDAQLGRFRIDWLVSHALLMGTVETTGTWIDIDDIEEVTVTGGVTTQTTTVLDGVLEIEEDVRVTVPVVDLQVKGSVQVASALRVGAGVFSSTAFNLPVAPGFVVPDDWTDVQGTGWRQQTRDVTFTGFTVFASIGF
jgi:hypothetical protein